MDGIIFVDQKLSAIFYQQKYYPQQLTCFEVSHFKLLCIDGITKNCNVKYVSLVLHHLSRLSSYTLYCQWYIFRNCDNLCTGMQFSTCWSNHNDTTDRIILHSIPLWHGDISERFSQNHCSLDLVNRLKLIYVSSWCRCLEVRTLPRRVWEPDIRQSTILL